MLLGFKYARSDNLDHSLQDIQVIGAGLGRTGTSSTQLALNILGFKTYHMYDVIASESHSHLWKDFAEGHSTVEDVITLMRRSGFNATIDHPAADIYMEQMRLFPDAKVILTVRESGAQWEKSWDTLMSVARVMDAPFTLTYPNFFRYIPNFNNLIPIRCMFGTFNLGLKPCELAYEYPKKRAGWLAEQYDAWVAKAKATVPASKLLEFNVKQGWEPLCAFLGKPVPNVPFPKSNDGASITRIKVFMQVVVYVYVPCLMLMVIGCSRCCCRLGRSKSKEKPL